MKTKALEYQLTPLTSGGKKEGAGNRTGKKRLIRTGRSQEDWTHLVAVIYIIRKEITASYQR